MTAINVSYYPGCSLHGTAREYADSTEAISKELGVELKELEGWSCCGASSGHITNDVLAFALPARNVLVADKAGMNMVVPCAACYQRLKVADKELRTGKQIEGIIDGFQGNFKIKHLTDFIWDDVGEKALRAKMVKSLKGLSPVCYYGCLITRPPKVTDVKCPDDPQTIDNILKALGADVKNWSFKTDCCGAGHVLTLPGVAYRLIQKLLDMTEEAGADCIVTGCPMCQSNLDSWQKEISRESGRQYNIPVFYFTELMGLSFGNKSVDKWLSRHTVDPRPLLKQRGLI
ncbi:MAG: CoB--CoM heterodisulfide reductase iron-sulfur subunit B family protein [Chloroflexi bacterium]|nr:CoB--CoM heterodisulfide reductase iron-sulfur subunit B family protein [Chloroflexota bacterium]